MDALLAELLITRKQSMPGPPSRTRLTMVDGMTYSLCWIWGTIYWTRTSVAAEVICCAMRNLPTKQPCLYPSPLSGAENSIGLMGMYLKVLLCARNVIVDRVDFL